MTCEKAFSIIAQTSNRNKSLFDEISKPILCSDRSEHPGHHFFYCSIHWCHIPSGGERLPAIRPAPAGYFIALSSQRVQHRMVYPSFGGGLPAYPNPLQMQFSFQQLFTFFVNPYIAILVSSLVYIIAGFWVTFLLLRDVLELKPLSAILGASFFIANGFFIERLVVGHADKITFPLIVIPVFALFYRKSRPGSLEY